MTQETLINLASPDFYFNRELSWLDFNRRVILEARDSHNPLLERMNFLAIGSSNLDEFFMVRVAGLQDQLKFGFDQPDSKTLMTSDQQLNAISEKTEKMSPFNTTATNHCEKKPVSISFNLFPLRT